MTAVNVSNKFGVGLVGTNVKLQSPPRGPFSAADAYLLAALLVTAAETIGDAKGDSRFSSWLDAVRQMPAHGPA